LFGTPEKGKSYMH
jgi:hypothetical protein